MKVMKIVLSVVIFFSFSSNAGTCYFTGNVTCENPIGGFSQFTVTGYSLLNQFSEERCSKSIKRDTLQRAVADFLNYEFPEELRIHCGYDYVDRFDVSMEFPRDNRESISRLHLKSVKHCSENDHFKWCRTKSNLLVDRWVKSN